MNIRDILAERAQSHGQFSNVAYLDQRLKDLFRSQSNWDNLSDPQRSFLDMTAMKLARILSGNTNEVDHYKDISGYAELCVMELEQASPAPYEEPIQRRDYSKGKSISDRLADLNAAQAAE